MHLTPQLVQSNARILAGLKIGAYDFLDFGTNRGGGFSIGERLGGRRGVGFELDPVLAQWNLDRGRDVMCLDVRTLPAGINGIRFAVCSHVLERLPSLLDVGSVVATLTSLCQDHLLICGPNFDADDDLYGHGLKVIHSAMQGHLCKIRKIDLIRLLFGLGQRDFVIGVSVEMRDSANVWIHHADAPAQGLWTWEKDHGLPKPFVSFDPPLHRDIVCVVKLGASVDADEVLRNFYWGCEGVIFRSTQRVSPMSPAISPTPLDASGTPPSTRVYHRASLSNIAQEPGPVGDGRPAIQRRPYLPPAILHVPPLDFGDTDLSRDGIVLNPPGNPGAQRLERGESPAYLLENAVVHGKYGVITLGDRVVEETLPHFPIHRVPEAAWENESELRLPEVPVSATVHSAYHLLACNLDNYFHWLVDAMSRFRLAEYEAFGQDPETAGTPILLLPTLDVTWKSESVDLLVPRSLPRISVAAEGCVFVQRLLYVPDLSGGAWNPHPALLDAFDTIRHRALGGLPAARPWRRLYISRTDSGNRTLINEADVIGRAERAGFSVVLLSTLSVAEQVRLFAEASHILAPHGAGLTNIGFCQPGAVLCELHMDSYVHWAFRRLAALRGVRYGCLIGTIVGDRGSEVHGNVWRLDLGALDALLSDSRFIS